VRLITVASQYASHEMVAAVVVSRTLLITTASIICNYLHWHRSRSSTSETRDFSDSLADVST